MLAVIATSTAGALVMLRCVKRAKASRTSLMDAFSHVTEIRGRDSELAKAGRRRASRTASGAGTRLLVSCATVALVGITTAAAAAKPCGPREGGRGIGVPAAATVSDATAKSSGIDT